MATQHDQALGNTQGTGPAQNTIDIEKDDASHREVKTEMLDVRGQRADYSGATKKTDPAEIKLVRKLDLWIMVSCATRTSSATDRLHSPLAADIVADVLAQLPRSERHHTRTPQRL